MTSTYDISESYEVNYARGPRFAGGPPQVPETPEKTFLGLNVRSRLGVAAGLLLNSTWVAGYAERGFDLLTYKTVRSSHRPCYPLPNWVYVEESEDEPGTYVALEEPPSDPGSVSSSVCFGMPSMDPDVWREDIGRAKELLGDGQLLIVSVVASPEENWNQEMLAGDFEQCARWAREAGADVIEANFSCPNVCSSEGSIYLDAGASRLIAGRMRKAIGETPLLIKTGQFEEEAGLVDYLHALNGVADGVTLVNCIVGRVLRRDGLPVFGNQFPEAGVLGHTIHDSCVQTVRRTATIIDRDKLTLQVLAVGGVADVADAERFFEAGANAVMMGSSPMCLPDLAVDLKRAHPEW